MKTVEPGPDGRPETIREWYHRSTHRWRKALVYATLVALCAAVVVYSLASFHLLARLQTFNGALTIPISAFIWILSFVYIFLVPSREVSFRSQESIERTVEILDEAVEKKVGPAVAVWNRIGERVEKELAAGLLEEVRTAVREIREAVARVERSSENSNGELKKFAEDARPALNALKRIQGRMEQEFGTGLFEDLRAAADAVKQLQPLPAKSTEPNLDKALKIVSKKRPVPAPAAPETTSEGAAPQPVPIPLTTVAAPTAGQNGNGGPS